MAVSGWICRWYRLNYDSENRVTHTMSSSHKCNWPSSVIARNWNSCKNILHCHNHDLILSNPITQINNCPFSIESLHPFFMHSEAKLLSQMQIVDLEWYGSRFPNFHRLVMPPVMSCSRKISNENLGLVDKMSFSCYLFMSTIPTTTINITLCNLQVVLTMFQVGFRSLLIPSCLQVSHDQILKELHLHTQEITRKMKEKNKWKEKVIGSCQTINDIADPHQRTKC